MWRKVNQGLTNTSTLLKQSRNHNNNNHHSNRNSNGNYNYDDEIDSRQAAQMHNEDDDGPVYANVQQFNPNWGYIDTSKCRKRRRKVKTRRNRYDILCLFYLKPVWVHVRRRVSCRFEIHFGSGVASAAVHTYRLLLFV